MFESVNRNTLFGKLYKPVGPRRSLSENYTRTPCRESEFRITFLLIQHHVWCPISLHFIVMFCLAIDLIQSQCSEEFYIHSVARLSVKLSVENRPCTKTPSSGMGLSSSHDQPGADNYCYPNAEDHNTEARPTRR